MGNRGHLTGKKITDSHTSITSMALAPVLLAQSLESVKKINLGIIKSIPNGEPNIKFLDIGPACFLAKIRGRRSIQEIYVYATHAESDLESIKLAMSNAFKK